MDVNSTVTSSAHHQYDELSSAASDAPRADAPAHGQPPESAAAECTETSPIGPPIDAIGSASLAVPVGLMALAEPGFQWKDGYVTLCSAHSEYAGSPVKAPTVDIAMQRFRHFFLRCLTAEGTLAACGLPLPSKQLDIAELCDVELKYAPGYWDYFIRRDVSEPIAWLTKSAALLETLTYKYETCLYCLGMPTPGASARASAASLPRSAADESTAGTAPPVATETHGAGPQPALTRQSPTLEVAVARFEAAIDACFALRWPARLQCDMEKVLITCTFSRDMVALFRHVYVESRAYSWARFFTRSTAKDIAYIDGYADVARSITARGRRAARFINAPQHAQAEIIVNDYDMRFTGVPDEQAFANAVLEYVTFVHSRLPVLRELNAQRK